MSVSCPMMGLAAYAPVWGAAGLVLAAIFVHSLGEVWESSAGFAFGFGLAPDRAQGQYQGLLGLGFSASQALAPAILITVVLGLGTAGWLLLAVFFAALGAAGPSLARWGVRSRPRSGFDVVPRTGRGGRSRKSNETHKGGSLRSLSGEYAGESVARTPVLLGELPGPWDG
ncbi:hypothetical protein ABZ456_28175 [Streptomyces sp. NPDC005776]|uniref:hypothetical protein n=1 Tax=Streptomyces sp. NPDC005776 TaxID=3154676 RepID=UPI0033E66F6A